MSKAILYDATLCIGCLQCEDACAKENKLRYDEPVAQEKKTSDHKFTFVAVRPNDKFMRRMCMHCINPSCASACPVIALKKTKLGPVSYDADRCMGCRYCMVACPFSIPKYEWSKALPAMRKCTMCADRLAAGGITACSEACPTGATITGERPALLAEARKRIAENPGQYVDHIYGEQEVGGTSVLLLSSVPFENFGLPPFGSEALPEITGKVLSHVPDVVTIGWALLGGVYWITNRRESVAASEGKDEKEEKR